MDNQVKDITIKFMYKDMITSTITFNRITEKVEVENWDGDILKTAFGNRINVTIKDMDDLFEDRCVPETRVNIDEYLEHYNLMFYDPYSIIKKTHGIMMEDFHWIKFEGEEDLTFREVRPDLHGGSW